jgi:hypothetical protein
MTTISDQADAMVRANGIIGPLERRDELTQRNEYEADMAYCNAKCPLMSENGQPTRLRTDELYSLHGIYSEACEVALNR